MQVGTPSAFVASCTWSSCFLAAASPAVAAWLILASLLQKIECGLYFLLHIISFPIYGISCVTHMPALCFRWSQSLVLISWGGRVVPHFGYPAGSCPMSPQWGDCWWPLVFTCYTSHSCIILPSLAEEVGQVWIMQKCWYELVDINILSKWVVWQIYLYPNVVHVSVRGINEDVFMFCLHCMPPKPACLRPEH